MIFVPKVSALFCKRRNVEYIMMMLVFEILVITGYTNRESNVEKEIFETLDGGQVNKKKVP